MSWHMKSATHTIKAQKNMPQIVSKQKHMEMSQIKFATISIKSHKLGHKKII